VKWKGGIHVSKKNGFQMVLPAYNIYIYYLYILYNTVYMLYIVISCINISYGI
jgi:hypothetical protein